MLPRAWTNIDDPVCDPNCVLIMFYNNQGISEITQSGQSFDKAAVIALMQADTWFIQNIEDSGEARTDLRSQTDALCFATRERCCRALE